MLEAALARQFAARGPGRGLLPTGCSVVTWVVCSEAEGKDLNKEEVRAHQGHGPGVGVGREGYQSFKRVTQKLRGRNRQKWLVFCNPYVLAARCVLIVQNDSPEGLLVPLLCQCPVAHSYSFEYYSIAWPICARYRSDMLHSSQHGHSWTACEL